MSEYVTLPFFIGFYQWLKFGHKLKIKLKECYWLTYYTMNAGLFIKSDICNKKINEILKVIKIRNPNIEKELKKK